MTLQGGAQSPATLPFTIRRYDTLAAGVLEKARRDIDEIFFEASSVQSFRDDAHRKAFWWLWLGRYLDHEPQHAFIAEANGKICGYVIGSLLDPALRSEFQELDYFSKLASQTAIYPAHLHINVASDMRSQGVGEHLTGLFERHAIANHCPGVHVVTGAGMRNVTFYARLGYREVGRVSRNNSEVVMLAKSLRCSDV